MNDVDSAVARQRIEDRGKDIDALSDYMDRMVDQKGNHNGKGRIILCLTNVSHFMLQSGSTRFFISMG